MSGEFLDFCPRLRTMLSTGMSVTENGDPINIRATSTLNNLHIIRELIKERKPQATLEIGLGFGASALTILITLREVLNRGFHHTAIDPFQGSNWKNSALTVIREEHLEDDFSFYEEVSSQVLPKLVGQHQQYGFIYVDGSHLFEDVFIDFYYSAYLLRSGGVILFDDTMDKHVAKVIRFIQRNFATVFQPLQLDSYRRGKTSLLKRIGIKFGIQQAVGFTKIGDPPRSWKAPFQRF